jgi:hypothetical protein
VGGLGVGFMSIGRPTMLGQSKFGEAKNEGEDVKTSRAIFRLLCPRMACINSSTRHAITGIQFNALSEALLHTQTT